MKKIISLIKACMTDNMQLFKVRSKNNTKTSKILLIVILTFFCMFSVWTYANTFMEPLVDIHQEYVLLSLFVMGTFFLTLIEGIYKSSSLLFNSRDDNLLLSLPIRKSTVIFNRIFKFYVFELIYNSIFMIPAIIVYIRYVNVDISFYIATLFMLLLLPIIPIVVSCIIGKFISIIASKFKFKNIIQTIITILLFLAILYISFNIQGLLNKLGEKATIINDLITKFYYPAEVYIKMVTNFKVVDLLLFIGISIIIFVFGIFIVSIKYAVINSDVKDVKNSLGKKNYVFKKNKPIIVLIKKELKRFVNSPVFITNSGLGLILFIIGIGLITINFDKAGCCLVSC